MTVDTNLQTVPSIATSNAPLALTATAAQALMFMAKGPASTGMIIATTIGTAAAARGPATKAQQTATPVLRAAETTEIKDREAETDPAHAKAERNLPTAPAVKAAKATLVKIPPVGIRTTGQFGQLMKTAILTIGTGKRSTHTSTPWLRYGTIRMEEVRVRKTSSRLCHGAHRVRSAK